MVNGSAFSTGTGWRGQSGQPASGFLGDRHAMVMRPPCAV
jgi:hypothetical protein